MRSAIIALTIFLMLAIWFVFHYKNEVDAAEERAKIATETVTVLEQKIEQDKLLDKRAEDLKSEIDNETEDCPAPDWLMQLPERLRSEHGPRPTFAY